jgi:glycosyltransferase involved in cell wall biosynthesis
VYLAPEGEGRQGPAAARNRGLSRASGEFVAFLDADDVWLRAKLERQVRALTRFSEAGMVYGPSEWWYSWAASPQERDYVEPLGVPPRLYEPGSLLRPFFADQIATVPNPSSMLVRRTVLDEVGGFEESVPHGYEDQTLVAKMALTVPVLAADRVLDRYRQHRESLTADRSERVEARDRVAFLRWLTAYLAEHGTERELVAALTRQRRRLRYRAWRPLQTGRAAR